VTSAAQGLEVDVGDGLMLHVESSGAGPPVLMLHGFTGSVTTWAPLRALLTTHFTTIAVDLPGHGQSGSPPDAARYSLTRFASDVRQVLDAIDVDRAAVLGYSLGARAALQFALSFPDRTAALVLESGTPGIDDAAERDARVASDSELAATIEHDGIVPFVDYWEKLALWSSQTSLSEAASARLREQRLANKPEGLANCLRGAGTGAVPSVFERLSELRMPVMLIAGALDQKFAGLAGRMAKAIPGSRLEIVEAAGHAVHLERPDDFSCLASDFLGQVVAEKGPWTGPASTA
jgi:2-succinyl-6-hydroxy-2,4-cyclohexadiene-1-carboxylate synthase